MRFGLCLTKLPHESTSRSWRMICPVLKSRISSLNRSASAESSRASALVEKRLASSPFRRVWVFNYASKAIDYVRPHL